jgi:hypothetical protein
MSRIVILVLLLIPITGVAKDPWSLDQYVSKSKSFVELDKVKDDLSGNTINFRTSDLVTIENYWGDIYIYTPTNAFKRRYR